MKIKKHPKHSLSKNAICLLTNEPDERLIQLYNDLIDIHYDFYVIVNNDNFDCTFLQKKYPKFHFIQMKNDNKKTSLWDKTIHYFCNYKLNVYKYIWFFDDNLFIPSIYLIYKIDNKFNHSHIDLLSKEPKNHKKISSKKVSTQIPNILQNHLCFSPVHSIRISNNFLNFIDKYIKEYKNIFSIRYFFCTLAKYYQLNTYHSFEFNNIVENKKWNLKDILFEPFSFIYPIKNLDEQIKFRKFFFINHTNKNKNINQYFLNQSIEPKHIEIRRAALKIDKKMVQVDSDIHQLYIKKPSLFKKPNFRFYKNENLNIQHIFDKQNAFVTTVFINEGYLPSALIWAKSFIEHKTKYPIICCVQDKPYIKNNETIFPGISKEAIHDLLKYYDLVVGVDLLEVENYKTPVIPNRPNTKHASYGPYYTNSRFYPTKLQVLGLFEFKQIFYIDAAAYIGQNIDFLFDIYKGNYFHEKEYFFIKSGAGGSHFMIQPSLIFYYKLKLFVHNYHKYFDHLFLKGTVDETLLYYSIFPYWDGLIEYGKYLDYKRWKKSYENRPIRHFMKYKPFRPLPDENTYQYITDEAFSEWNSIGKKVIKQYPQFKKYYEHIPSFRKTKLFNK